jgi:hypothetical protein
MANNDSIKWWPKIQVLKYGPESIREVVAYMDTHRMRPVDRAGQEPTGPELRMMEQLKGLAPDEITHGEGNSLVTVGQDRIVDLICANGSPQAFTWNATASLTRAFAGVGDSSATTTSGMVALQAASNRFYAMVDAQPTSVNGVISANTTYGSGEAEFAWNEWCWGIAASTITEGATFPASGVMLNRKAQSLGTKGALSTWTLQASVTIT